MRTLPARLGLGRPAAQWSLLAASLLVVVLSVRVAFVARRFQHEIQQLQTANRDLQDQHSTLQEQVANARGRYAETAKQLERERAVSFVLSMGLTAGGGPPRKLMIPGDSEIVRLELSLPRRSDYESYRVGLRGAPGDEFWSQGRLQPIEGERGMAVRLLLPASAVTPGHYELALGGQISPGRIEDVGYYYFEAVRN